MEIIVDRSLGHPAWNHAPGGCRLASDTRAVGTDALVRRRMDVAESGVCFSRLARSVPSMADCRSPSCAFTCCWVVRPNIDVLRKVQNPLSSQVLHIKPAARGTPLIRIAAGCSSVVSRAVANRVAAPPGEWATLPSRTFSTSTPCGRRTTAARSARSVALTTVLSYSIHQTNLGQSPH
jgi:hypothetical protein